MLQFVPYVFLFLGLLLLIMVPVLIKQLREDPSSVFRPQYQILPAGCAYILGGLIIAIALAAGSVFVFIALNQLRII